MGGRTRTESVAMARALLLRMTPEEKLAQLGAYMFFDTFWHRHDTYSEAQRIEFIDFLTPGEMIPPEGLGFITTQLRDLPPRKAAQIANRNHEHTATATRHGIPVIIHDEGVHGLIGNGATIFPSALGMAASWNPWLMEQVAGAIGREARARGVRQLLSPTLNLGRDPRCGRVEETYGEDPLLASRLGVAYIRAVQEHGVVCTPKHFVANFEADGGRDSWPAYFSPRWLREVLLPPFEAAIREGGALSLMSAYGSLDGVPASADRWLLTELLRDEWGFTGYVVSDYHAVAHLHELHGVSPDATTSACRALEAGMDVELPRFQCFGPGVLDAIREGRLAAGVLDEAALRVLAVKYQIGLMDDPMADPDEAERVTNCPLHRQLALEMARESAVLLRNADATLPLRAERVRRLLVTGPNADSIETGDYSWDLVDRLQFVTVLDGMTRTAPPEVEIVHEPGCALGGDDPAGIEAAVAAARDCDAIVTVVGSSVRLAGEARDRQSLDLPGRQEDFLLALAATGRPLIVVVLTGGVHTMTRWFDRAGAVIHAWYAGEMGGVAIAEILFGIVNPSGRLPITIPRNIGQCPIAYDARPSGRGHTYGRLGQDGGIHLPFGHGLSYSTVVYQSIKISGGREGIVVEVTLQHEAGPAVSELVQVYLRDLVAPVAAPLKRLVAFGHVRLEPGGTARVELSVPADSLRYLDRQLQPAFEPGEFEVMVGASAEDIRLTKRLHID